MRKLSGLGISLCFGCVLLPIAALGNDAVNHEAKIDALIEKMTLAEKLGQLTLYSSKWGNTGPLEGDGYVDEVRNGECGSLLTVPAVRFARPLQKLAIEETRLGIPLMFGYDVIHGYETIFPIPLAETSSWDLDLIEHSSRVAAEEAAASGINWVYAPMVDVSRDPRWGRVAEGSGEDVYLTSQVAKAKVRGFQGGDLAGNNTVAACVKHFAAYGAAQGGRDYHTVDVSERVLRETYLPPFKAAIDAGAKSIMTSFNEVDGVPATGSSMLLEKILRNEWGFDGVVVTDYTSINEMVAHGAAHDDKQAAQMAIEAGVDLDMVGASFINYLPDLIKEGAVSEEMIDDSVRRVLQLKFELGLFDDPYRYLDEAREKATLRKPGHLEASYQMALKSMVLLKNDAKRLPLKESLNIALVGPLADAKLDLLGTWKARGQAEHTASIKDAFDQRLGEGTYVYATGCSAESDSLAGIAEAVRMVQRCDVVVLALGEPSWMSGEAASRSNLDLPGSQKALVNAIAATGRPVVLVLLNGRPLTIAQEVAQVDAVLEAWHPGSMGAKAVVDTLFGDSNPSGKLPMSFPRNLGQVPIFYDQKNTGRPYIEGKTHAKYSSKYLDVSNSPLFPFGFGLSYTTFEMSNMKLDRKQMKPGGSVGVSVQVMNTGEYDGEEVVQLYIRDRVASVTRPVKQLKGFKKVQVKQGELLEVKFTLTEEDLAFLRRDMSWGVEPGWFDVFVGANSRDTLQAEFELLAD